MQFSKTDDESVNEYLAKCEFSRYTDPMEQQFIIRQAEFVTSAGLSGQYPEPLPCEIAIVGKSNVGKSSLINRLANNQKLAKTSAQPGKTRLVNFFLLNKALYLVDLPGYGFAKASKTEQKSWGELLERYLSSGRVKHLLMLIDIRHAPTQDDLMMFRYLIYYNIPYTLVATKADKIAKSKRKQEANKRAKELGAPPFALPFSSETGEGKAELLQRIGQICEDCIPKEKESPEE